MQRKFVLLFLTSFCLTGRASADDKPLRVRLFDFETGVTGWLGNPWGGGKCGVEPSRDAKFGDGALRGWYADVEKGANVICPYLPEDAAWRKSPWGGISFYLKGDGSPSNLTLQLETDEKTHPTYSRSVPLEDTEWRRVFLPFSTFWNRGGQTFDVARMRRFYFGTSGTHHFLVDEIQLEAPHREIPLTPLTVAALPRCMVRPVLDGKLEEACWKQAIVLPPLGLIDGSSPAKEQTQCRMFHDGSRLYIGATLTTADAKRLRATLTRHDSPVYTDDCFEVFITGDEPKVRYYQFVVNPLGTTLELSSKQLLAFEHDWKAAVKVSEKEWTVEVSLALSPLLRNLAPSATFGLNLCRENQVNGELSCWSPTGWTFLRPQRFGRALLSGNEPPVDLSPPAWNDYGGGMFAARLDASSRSGQPKGLRLHAVMRVGDQAVTSENAPNAADPANQELLAPVSARLEQEGEAQVEFSVLTAEGQPISFHAFRYQVYLPDRPSTKPSVLPIDPSPKEATTTTWYFSIPRTIYIGSTGKLPVDTRVTDFLTRELRRWYAVSTRSAKDIVGATVLLVKHERGKKDIPGKVLPPKLAARLERFPAEGYLLVNSSSRVVIAANDDAGLYYGAQTFLQNVNLATTSPDSPRARCGVVVDWPSLKWRALTVSLPTERWGYPNDPPVSVEFFCDFIERYIARHKFNALALMPRQGIRYDTHPELAGPAAWSKADVRRVVETCRANFIEPIPLVDSYGHAQWMTLDHKELWEDNDPHIACTSNPETFKILTDVYSELLEVFAPVRYFHLGLDEVWWRTLDIPADQRCKLCAAKPKGELFADQVIRLHDWLQARGVRSMMWSDVLLPEHNGGAPYHGSKALELIPKDILQTNWSTSLASASNKRLHDAGFPVWQSNSLGVNREQAQYCEGNMFGVWTKLPWLADAPWASGQGYSYLNFPIAAEFSWNLWPEVKTLEPPLTWSWLRQHEDSVLAREGLSPEPRATGKTFSVPLSGNMSTQASEPPDITHWFGALPDADLRNLPRGEVVVGGVPFHLPQAPMDCLSPLPTGQGKVTIPVGRKAASLRFLHTAHLFPDKLESFSEGFKKAAYWAGIPMGDYTIVYEEGSTEHCPILYANNVKRWEIGDSIPYVFRSVGFLYAATEKMLKQDPNGRDVCLYVAQWVNPHPDKVIRSIELTGSAEAVPVLFAITGRETR